MVLQEGDHLKANTCSSKDDFVQVNNQSTFVNMSPKQLPPSQVMERSPEGYDPNRISTSVFGRPSTAMDWSVASNESLFSINAGNPNFSIDLGLKTGELRQSDESVRLKQVNPATKGGVDRKKILDMPKIAEPINDFTYAFRINQVATNIRQSRDPLSAQCLPDQSCVLTFPLTRKKKFSCSPCHCPGFCKRPSCWCKCFSCSRNCCKWPQCCCKLPSCKCLTCSSCSCKCLTCSKSCFKCPNWLSCNCLTCSSCSCKCPSCPSLCFKCPNCLSCKCLTC